ncbi:hypothetical protein CAPTEDRAFT_194491 [Capitella teleta]|uniref:G-protein coupled receptors family 1 profile domain-containing protein n=1 Tax=Capitella teleta TaxID=283909 RepID=R7TDK5_CAPTE|nr:hypothetical protein CAPTEDRAFT_194491 [Capitella teleta]|eukprot:ELT89151.1 hypothetical protein CAPTEDRAFT_194491 [Capitella teleta]
MAVEGKTREVKYTYFPCCRVQSTDNKASLKRLGKQSSLAMDTISNSTVDANSYISYSLDRESYRFLFIRELSIATTFGALVIVLREILMVTGFNVPANNPLCKFILIATVGGMQVDLLTLLVIAADQYILIAYPFRYHDLLTKPRVTFLASVPLVIALTNSVLMAAIWDDTYLCTFYQNLPRWFLWLLLCDAIGMAFVGTVTLQVLTIRIARRHMLQLQANGQGQVSAETVRRHWRGVVTTLLICVMIFFSWILGIIVLLRSAVIEVEDLYSSKYFNGIILSSSYLYLLRGIWVPLIFAIRTPEIRPVITRIRKLFPAWKSNDVTAMRSSDA